MQKAIADIFLLNLPFDQKLVKEIKAPIPLQRAFKVQNCSNKGLFVIATAAVEQDDNLWLHVSFSRRDTMPNYSDMIFVKQQFFGDTLKAIMVFPPKSQHINIAKYCLHFWANLEQDILPDFRIMNIGI